MRRILHTIPYTIWNETMRLSICHQMQITRKRYLTDRGCARILHASHPGASLERVETIIDER